MPSLGVFDDQKQGVVDASGDLRITFQCPLNQRWTVQQITGKMLTAPAGASLRIEKGNALIAPTFSARKAAVGNLPYIPVRGGESISVVWEDCTPGDIGLMFILYEAETY